MSENLLFWLSVMIKRLKHRIRRDPWLLVPTGIMALVALALVVASIPLGLAWSNSDAAPGYISLRKLNWTLFPIFFLILGTLAHASWTLYLRAWRSLPASGVLHQQFRPENNPKALDPLLGRLSTYRHYLAAVSVLLGLILTAIDAGCLWGEYGIVAHTSPCNETDFTVAFRLAQEFPSVSKTANGAFVTIAYLLQGGLIALGWFALLQISLHGFYFAAFESCSVVRAKKLAFRLNIRDPLHEFGLSEVNRAINTMYVLVAIGMVLPVLSAAGQQSDIADLGQLLLRWLLPLILLVPLIVPLADRYFRLREASERVRKSGDRSDAEEFAKQQLWPFERTQIAYLGKAMAGLAAAEYLYVLGRNAADLLKQLPFFG